MVNFGPLAAEIGLFHEVLVAGICQCHLQKGISVLHVRALQTAKVVQESYTPADMNHTQVIYLENKQYDIKNRSYLWLN